MKLDGKLGMTLAGVWFILIALRDLGVFNIGSIHSAILPVIALIAGVLLLIR